MPLTGTYTDRTIRPSAGNELQSQYVQTGGRLAFDLRNLPPGAHPAPIRADLGVGQIEVFTSPCVPVDITAGVNAGDVSLSGVRGRDTGGFSASGSFRTDGSDPVVMDLHTGLGEVRVERGYITKKQRKACGR